MSGLLFGYDASSINAALPLMRNHFGLTSKMEARLNPSPTCWCLQGFACVGRGKSVCFQLDRFQG